MNGNKRKQNIMLMENPFNKIMYVYINDKMNGNKRK